MSRAGRGHQWLARLSLLTGNSCPAVAFAVGLALAAVACVTEAAKGQIPCRLEVAAIIQAPPGPLTESPTFPLGISPNGQYVVGWYRFDAVAADRGWYYEMPDGPFTPLPHPPGYGTSSIRAVNDQGLAVGFIAGTAGDFGFVYDIPNGQFLAMIPPDALNGTCELTDINASGVACGVRSLKTDTTTTAFIWHPVNGVTNLGLIDGLSSGFMAISNSNLVAGYRGTFQGANSLGIIGNPSSPLVISPAPGGTTSTLRDINAHGDACGFGRIPQQSNGFQNHAFIWSGGVMTMLGTLPAMNRCHANVMMDNGVVAGQYRGTPTHQNEETAFLWFGGSYTKVDDLLFGAFDGEIQSVGGAADDGTLTGWAVTGDGDSVAIVLRPKGINPGDVTHDCITNVSDLLLVISDWGGFDSDADANGDGFVNVSDLLLVLTYWGA